LTFSHLLFISPCCCGTQIDQAIQIIVAAAGVFSEGWAVLLYPLFHNTAIAIAIICWLIGLLFMSTAGDLSEQADGVYTLVYDENFQRALVYYGVCIVWIVEFMGAVGFMIVAGCILIIFFNNDEKREKIKWPLMSSFRLVLCNHMGTAAIGSFLITVVVIIRWIVTALLEKAKAEQKDNKVLQYVASCIECCCACIEECMRYMVNTAYILTVLEGRWFFSAVCGGLWTLLSNAPTVFTTNYISFLVIWLCKLSVPLVSTGCAYFMIESGKFGCDKYDLSSTFNVLVPVFLISCIFSFTFIGLLGTAIDVVLIAFLKCEEMDEHSKEEGAGSILASIPKNCQALKQHLDDGREEDRKKEQEDADETAKKEGTGEGQALTSETAKDADIEDQS